MNCLIKTNDGFEKEAPLTDDITEWIPKYTQVELHHSTHNWTAQYIVDSVSQEWNGDEMRWKVILKHIEGTRVWLAWKQSPEMRNLIDEWAKDIQEEIDGDIIEKFKKLI